MESLDFKNQSFTLNSRELTPSMSGIHHNPGDAIDIFLDQLGLMLDRWHWF